jgi:hypothetical protein
MRNVPQHISHLNAYRYEKGAAAPFSKHKLYLYISKYVGQKHFLAKRERVSEIGYPFYTLTQLHLYDNTMLPFSFQCSRRVRNVEAGAEAIHSIMTILSQMEAFRDYLE